MSIELGGTWRLDPNLTAPVRKQLESILESRGLGADEFAVATSGSTGAPKWIVHKVESAERAAEAYRDFFDIQDRDTLLSPLPDHHVSGLMPKVRARQIGCKWLPLDWRRWKREAFQARAIAEMKLSGQVYLSLVPTQIYDLVDQQVKPFPGLRVVHVGGAKIAEDVFARALDLGWPLVLSYGMTETCAMWASQRLGAKSVWDPLVPFATAEFQVSEDLEILVKSPSLFKECSQEGGFAPLASFLSDGGFFPTGDKGEPSVGGGFQVMGRSDRLVKILAEKVSLDQVEEGLQKLMPAGHPLFSVKVTEDKRRGFRLLMVVNEHDLNPEQRSLWEVTLLSCLQRWNQDNPEPLRVDEGIRFEKIPPSWKREPV